MIRGLYTAVSGMIVQENKQNVIANNIANAETVGFKSDNLIAKSFKDVMMINHDKGTSSGSQKVQLGTMSLGSSVAGVYSDFSQGTIKETGNDTDFAIIGNGFFKVSRESNGMTEEYYTRDGNFQVNIQGYLVNNYGDYVLDKNSNKIYVGDGKITANENGDLSIENSNGTVNNYSLAVVDFEDYTSLNKVGDNLYSGEGAVDINAKVQHKSVEGSNINIMNEMVNLMSVMRDFESNQTLIQTIDESLGKVINTVGSVRG